MLRFIPAEPIDRPQIQNGAGGLVHPAGNALAQCFTGDGVYHDGFYGAFQGPSRIRAFLEDHVYRTLGTGTFANFAGGRLLTIQSIGIYRYLS